MGATIGIKIANGYFYPILEEDTVVTKRLIVTTVHDNQERVHIELYKSTTSTLVDALYIGRLVVEHIKPAQSGEPSIELVISSNQTGEIAAKAVNLDPSAAHEQQSLQVSRNSVGAYTWAGEIPEPLESMGVPPHGLYETESGKKRVPWLLVLLIGLVPIVLILGFLFVSYMHQQRSLGQEDLPVTAQSPALTEPSLPPEQSSVLDTRGASGSTEGTELAPEVSGPLGAVPVITAPAVAPPQELAPNRNRPTPPVASYKIPTTIPREGVTYRIRWGDTLWDISEAFYRNPWLYLRIARFNNIRRPDLIVAGRTIRIPPPRN
ncbi:MAG: LysM peptidoglycan-binding domain-containing protein [Treponema sp.]|jgi:hypothetical protein|nr:LysM peptidoglycan-binding domain-containing protein [Treponema sp.]